MKKLLYICFVLFLCACKSIASRDCQAKDESGVLQSDKSPKVVELLVGPALAPCHGEAPMECMQVKYVSGASKSTEWEHFYSPIAGFTYEPGYTYRLEVALRHKDVREVAPGQSSITYELVKMLSKEPVK